MQKAISLITRTLFSRLFLFFYAMGIVSSMLTIPDVKGAHLYGNLYEELFLDLFLLSLLVHLISSRRLRVAVKAVIYVLTYPVYIADTFCFVKFGTTLNPSMLLLMGETNSSEAGEFLSSYVTPDVLLSPVGIILAFPLLHAILAPLPKRFATRILKPLDRYSLSSLGVACRLLCVALCIFAPCLWIYCLTSSLDNKKMIVQTMSRDTIGQIEHDLASEPRPQFFQPPYRLAFSIYCNHLASQQLDKLKATVSTVAVDSCSVKNSEIVFIIGESFNKRHAQLYGYDKTNMPNQVRMEQEGALVKFSDVVAPWNLTSFVFKHLMTTYCVGDEGDWCDYPLFCEIFRKAGYRVTFLTNQFQTKAKEAVYDFSGGFFLNDPDLSKAQYDIRNEDLHIFDDGLLSDYAQLVSTSDSLSAANGKAVSQCNLTIFHLMGMHVNYRVRCPNRLKQWDENSYPNDTDLSRKQRRTLADYDNAVWYNDSVVNQIVERFKDKEAVIIYMPDHGEEVFGPGARHFFGRMHKTSVNKRLADEEFRIPMWIYCTEKYRQAHPDAVQAIAAAKDKPFMTDAMPHVLLGLAGIHCRYYNPRYDLLSPQYDAGRKRILKHTIDYDDL